FNPSLLSTTAATGFGLVTIVRAALALGFLAVVARAWRGASAPSWFAPAGGALALGLVVATAAVGHPVAGPWPGLELPVTVVHVGSMAVWLGGLTGLLAGVLRPDVPAGELAVALPRFSRLAFG